MTKSDLVRDIQMIYRYYPREDMSYAVNVIFEAMAASLKRNERIEIRDFGVFSIKNRQSRNGKNPKTGKSMHIQERKLPFFKVGKDLKKRINESHLISD